MASSGQEFPLLQKGSELRGKLKEFHPPVDTYASLDYLFHSFSSCLFCSITRYCTSFILLLLYVSLQYLEILSSVFPSSEHNNHDKLI